MHANNIVVKHNTRDLRITRGVHAQFRCQDYKTPEGIVRKLICRRVNCATDAFRSAITGKRADTHLICTYPLSQKHEPRSEFTSHFGNGHINLLRTKFASSNDEKSGTKPVNWLSFSSKVCDRQMAMALLQWQKQREEFKMNTQINFYLSLVKASIETTYRSIWIIQ